PRDGPHRAPRGETAKSAGSRLYGRGPACRLAADAGARPVAHRPEPARQGSRGVGSSRQPRHLRSQRHAAGDLDAMMPALRLLAVSWLAFCAMAAHAQQASEATVKAAFLYKFAGYVEWPASALPAPDTAVTIAIAGNNDVAEELEKLAPGRKVNGRPVLVRRLRTG